MKIQRQLTTKSGRQIKAAVSSTLMQIKENEKITDPEKHSASFLWNELFQSVFGHDAEMKAIVEKHHDAFESFFSDKAEEVEFEDGRNREVKLAREEREIAGVPKQAEVDIPEIYRYLAALSSRKNKTLPRLNIATSALLVELLEEIEREADDVVSPNLHDELNKRYAATLTNRRYVPFLDSQRKVFQRTNKEFDEFNPLALSLEKWTERIEEDGSTEMVDTFSMEFESSHVDTS